MDIGGANNFSILIRKFECWSFGTPLECTACNPVLFQILDRTRMHRLNIRWNIFRDQFFAFSVNFPQ